MTGDQHLTTPHDSLVGMAELKRLPRHQYMDSATVDWIEEHRPLFEARGEPRLTALRPLSRRVLSHAVIPAAWFADPRLADSIHGVRHGARVAALAALLAESGRFDDVTTCTAVVAAAIHDCRRAHDQDDRGHGERAGRWFIRDSATVVARFGLPARMVRVRRAAIAARLHEIPYAEFTAHDEREYLRAQTVTDVLKSADALDRYRLPKIGRAHV